MISRRGRELRDANARVSRASPAGPGDPGVLQVTRVFSPILTVSLKIVNIILVLSVYFFFGEDRVGRAALRRFVHATRRRSVRGGRLASLSRRSIRTSVTLPLESRTLLTRTEGKLFVRTKIRTGFGRDFRFDREHATRTGCYDCDWALELPREINIFRLFLRESAYTRASVNTAGIENTTDICH